MRGRDRRVRHNLLSKIVAPRESLVAVGADVRPFLSVGAHVPRVAAQVEGKRQPNRSCRRLQEIGSRQDMGETGEQVI